MVPGQYCTGWLGSLPVVTAPIGLVTLGSADSMGVGDEELGYRYWYKLYNGVLLGTATAVVVARSHCLALLIPLQGCCEVSVGS